MNEIVKIMISLFIGIIGGALTVYTGIGASMMVPLVMFFGLIKDYRTAVGTMLLVVLTPAFIFPVYSYYKSDRIDLTVGIPIAIGYIIGNYITSVYFMDSIKNEIIYLIFGIYSLVVGYVFIKKSKYIF
jgi:uncharacterized membrane protein YfcA